MNKILVAIVLVSAFMASGCTQVAFDPFGEHNEKVIQKANEGTLERHAEEKDAVAKDLVECPEGFKLPDNDRAATIRSRARIRNNTRTRTRNRAGIAFPERDSQVNTNVNSTQNCVLDR